MGLDLRKSAVNVRAQADHAMLNGGSGRFRCRRCQRNLPDDQFQLVDFNFKRDVLYLHPLCNLCRRQLKSEWASHPLVTPSLHRFLTQLAQGAKTGARSRGIVFALEIDDVLGMYVRQHGRCALTGETLTHQRGTVTGRERSAASLDRIESARNYTLDNVHLVCQVVNLMKSNMSMEEFGSWCSRIVLHSLQAKG